MTKAELAEKVYEKVGFPHGDAMKTIEATLEIIKETLEQGGKVKIFGFGNFVVRSKHERLGRNPYTKQALTITVRKVVRFKASQILKQAVNPGQPASPSSSPRLGDRQQNPWTFRRNGFDASGTSSSARNSKPWSAGTYF